MQVFDIFVDSLKSDHTKSKYQYHWDRFAKYLPTWKKVKDVNILTKSIIGYLVQMKEEGLSYSYRSVALASLKHYYSMDDLLLNWKKISKFLGEDTDKDPSNGYTTEQIQKLLEFSDVKYRAVILTYAATGMRREALVQLKVGDFEYLDKYQLYKIRIYKNSKSSQICYTTPEAASAITLYIKTKGLKKTDLFHDVQPKAVSTHLRGLGIQAGIAVHHSLAETEGIGRYRSPIPPIHGLRKFCTNQMKRAKVDNEYRKILTGHSIGVEKSYIQPTEDELLAEYSKAIPFLTIGKENILTSELKDLAIKNEGFVNSVDIRLKEKDEQIRELKKENQEFRNTLSEFNKTMHEMLTSGNPVIVTKGDDEQEYEVIKKSTKEIAKQNVNMSADIDKLVKGTARNIIKKSVKSKTMR